MLRPTLSTFLSKVDFPINYLWKYSCKSLYFLRKTTYTGLPAKVGGSLGLWLGLGVLQVIQLAVTCLITLCFLSVICCVNALLRGKSISNGPGGFNNGCFQHCPVFTLTLSCLNGLNSIKWERWKGKLLLVHVCVIVKLCIIFNLEIWSCNILKVLWGRVVQA